MVDELTHGRTLGFRAGLTGLLVAAVASAVLSADHLELLGEHLPGCGPASGCARLTRGAWGRLPGIDWPTAYVGLALFGGLLVTWMLGRGGALAALRPVAIAGGFVSAGFLGLMFVLGAVCPWCLAVHLGNLLFVAAALWGAPASGAARGPLLAGGLVAVLLTGALAAANHMRAEVLAERRAERLAESTAAILDQASRPPDGTAFTGLWVTGAADAPIRVVVFADYQCDGCNAVEREAAALLASRTDVSLSVKQFPMGRECHPDLTEEVHSNACESARAAEAAGILGGNDGYWRMHDWLVAWRGTFSPAELVAALPGLGFDPERFTATMAGAEVAGRIQADIAEGKALGLSFVPMVFVNGVELKDVETAGALSGVVTALAAELERGAAPSFVAPASALDKAIDDFLDMPVETLPSDPGSFPRGATAPALDVVVFGDYGQAFTRDLDRLLEQLLSTHTDIRYTFRHFPLDPTCNELKALKSFPVGTCRLAALAEAAGRVAGADAYWRVHRWLFAHQGAGAGGSLTGDTSTDDTLTDEALRAAAPELQLDAPTWFAEAGSADVARAIATDVAAWQQLGLQGVPIVFVNGRRVPRWRLIDQPDAPLLERILEAAREGR